MKELLAELHAERPAHVPPEATLLVSWIDLPGDNAQRTQGHWKAKEWKDALRRDFRRTLDAQRHPGLLESPMVHIRMHVGAVGDERNRTGRAKFVIDRLQVRREVSFKKKNGSPGLRVFGDLSIIADDRVLNSTNCTLEEVRAPARERRVQVWVWPA